MIDNYNEKIDFGKYNGLSLKEIYQGTLNIDRHLLADFLNHILNSKDFQEWSHSEIKHLVERFDLSNGVIEVVGQIFNEEKSKSLDNKVVFGNQQNEIQSYIDKHFQGDFLGITVDIGKFNNINKQPLQIGGDPQYLKWCENNVPNFKIAESCKRKLEKFPVAKFIGIDILYIGNETYEYAPKFSIEKYKF